MPSKKNVPEKVSTQAKEASEKTIKAKKPAKRTMPAGLDAETTAKAGETAVSLVAVKEVSDTLTNNGGRAIARNEPGETVLAEVTATVVEETHHAVEPIAIVETVVLQPKETHQKTPVKISTSNMPDNKATEQKQNSPKGSEALVRYTDADLADFRELINKKMNAAKKELNYLQGLITRKDDMGGDESESRYMTMEDGSMSMEREQLSQMASRQLTYIDHLEKALIRIENKTYGICRVTGKLIDKARLRAVPHATLSLEAKLGLVKPSGE